LGKGLEIEVKTLILVLNYCNCFLSGVSENSSLRWRRWRRASRSNLETTLPYLCLLISLSTLLILVFMSCLLIIAYHYILDIVLYAYTCLNQEGN